MAFKRDDFPEHAYRLAISLLLALTAWFSARVIAQQDDLVENMKAMAEAVHKLDTRVTVLEYENGRPR